jgi:hypothetical protein
MASLAVRHFHFMKSLTSQGRTSDGQTTLDELVQCPPVHIVEQSGHLPHMEKGGELNRLLKRLMENQT